MSFKILNLIYILLNISNIAFLKYPIFKDIDTSEKGEIRAKSVKSIEEFGSLFLKNEYIITSFFFVPFEGNIELIKKFDILSSYKILHKWEFLKIICEEPNHMCQLYEKNAQNSPIIKLYVKSKELKAMNSLIELEFDQLIEYLLKLSTNQIIDINDTEINDYYNKYGNYSPLVIYDTENSEFISCITMLAKKKYYQYFYFGTIPMNAIKEKKEKIIFNKEHFPISFTWEGECDDVDEFLSHNLYPLINKVDKSLTYQLNLIPKILVILIGNLSENDKINKFITNYYQKVSYNYRDFVFGYIDYPKDKYFINKYRIDIKNGNDIQIMIYNCYDNIYYLHPILFNIQSKNEKEIYENINDICKDLENLSFTSGSLIKDIIRKIGLYKVINKFNKNPKGMIVLFAFIIILFIYYFFFNSKTEQENKKPKND